MRYVARIELDNWGPFKGDHAIDLKPTVYAVVATHEDDPERSNWIGKTWFLSAVLFALTGSKPDQCRTEDDWITRGENHGGVRLTADDGTVIYRHRTRTRSTQLEVTFKGGKVQKQKVAQENLYIAMGVGLADLEATSFIRQKQISRLITADPSVRTDIVTSWVNLAPLQRAEAWVRTQLNDKLAALKALDPGECPAGDSDELEGMLAEANEHLGNIRARRSQLQKQLATLNEWKSHADNADELADVKTEGKELKRTVDATEVPDTDPLEAEVAAAVEAKGRAMDREHELGTLMDGDWDGQCPLTCENCPAESEVRAMATSMELERNEAEIVLDEAVQTLDKAKAKLKAAREKADQRSRDEQKLVQLRDRAKRLLPSKRFIDEHGAPPGTDEIVEELDILNEDIDEWAAHAAEVTGKLDDIKRHAKAAQKAEKRRAALEGEVRTHREAVAVLGRQGAQREVAESALQAIQRKANRLLVSAGLDLQVDVRWAREGRGLATHCESCGAAFPTSLKVKTCDICGAERGPKLVEKLDIVPTDRSGAADDIAGLAFQLGAAAWLRAKRSALWSCTCIDEPFGALDTANVRALSTHLHTMIRSAYAFDQGFLVAHDAQVMDSLPARVQIYGSAEGSVLEVIG